MNKIWLNKLALDIEKKHGKEARDKIFGDMDSVTSSHTSRSAWFNNFITGMDELDDKDFLQKMMTEHCPCGSDASRTKLGKKYKKIYDKSESLDEFVASIDFGDAKELCGNVLYLTKYPRDHKVKGSCGGGCHCSLAKHTEKYISDIFCYCCTVGHTGIPFKKAFGDDIKIEFIDSVIMGGKGCTMAIHLPPKA